MRRSWDGAWSGLLGGRGAGLRAAPGFERRDVCRARHLGECRGGDGRMGSTIARQSPIRALLERIPPVRTFPSTIRSPAVVHVLSPAEDACELNALPRAVRHPAGPVPEALVG